MKKIDKSKKFLIVGLGLLGGCYAMALKKKGYSVSAITKEQDDIDYAIGNGLIDRGSTKVDKELVEDADIIVFMMGNYIDVLQLLLLRKDGMQSIGLRLN